MVTFTAQGCQTCLRATFAGRGAEGTTTITNALNQLGRPRCRRARQP